MHYDKDIILAVDYHDKNMEIRWFNAATGEERRMNVATSRRSIRSIMHRACREAAEAGGRVVWIMESTTGWARVKRVVAPKGLLVLANVLQMPLPPKAYRRKTDKIDTGRILREYLNGTLPVAHQTPAETRRARRLAACRESLVRRRTALRNWTNRYLAHELWVSRTGLWSERGIQWLTRFAERLGPDNPDGFVIKTKLAELDHLASLLSETEAAMMHLYDRWPMAQWVDEIRGIGPIAAVSILSHIGPVDRFADAEALVCYAGLAPGVRQSDGHSRNLRIGGGGTDTQLRHYLIEASVWAREIPRYRKTYERIAARRGKKVGRIVVARMLLRSIYKMLRDRVRFNQGQAA